MADDWIKFRKDLLTSPRIVRIASALRADRLRTVGAVMSVWCLFDDHTEDGTLPGYSPEVLDELSGQPGIARAMEAVGWLRITNEGIEAVNFTEHNGQTAKKRAQDAVRKMSARKADKRPAEERTKSGPEKEKDNIQSTLSPAQARALEKVDEAISVAQSTLAAADELLRDPVDTSPPTVRPTQAQFVAECARYHVAAWFAQEAFETWEVKEWRTGKTPVSWRHVAGLYVVRDFTNAGKPDKPPGTTTNRTHGNGKATAAIDNRNAGTANAGRSDNYAGVGRTAPAPGGGAHVAGANGAAV